MPKTTNPGHLLKQISSAIFSAFLSDLGRVTQSGLTEEECDANKQWLDAIADTVAVIPEPDDPTGKRILDRVRDIKKVYDHWNFPEHSPTARAEARRKLQDKVSNLSAAYGKRTVLLEKKLDRLVYRKFYSATSELVGKVPNKLAEMGRTLARFPHL
jgi:hypothetical protein